MTPRSAGAVLGLIAIVLWPVGCRRIVGAKDDYVPFSEVTHRGSLGPEVTSLHATILVGELRVVGGAEGEFRVEAEVKISKSRAAAEPDQGRFADHVRLEIKNARLAVADAHMDQSDKSDWRVSLVLYVPARLAATVKVTAGRIRVESMASDLDLENDAGEIVVTADRLGSVTASVQAGNVEIEAGTIGGPVKATVAVGSIALSITESPPRHNVRLEAETGNISLALPKGAPGTFRVDTEVGAIDVSGREGVTVTRSGLGATARGTVGSDGPTYDLSATVGAVTVR